MIRVTHSIALGEEEIRESFIRSSGPGGQNVNKVSSAVQLRFDAARSPSLPEAVRERLLRLAGKRINADGVLVIEAQRFRAQHRNRRDALERLVMLVRRAAQRPRIRRATTPGKKAKEQRLAAKRRVGEKKKLRGKVAPD